MIYKKAYDISGLPAEDKEYLRSNNKEALSSCDGIACDKIVEPIPKYLAAPCEKVVSGENNAWIVLGRDRPGSRLAGYGGRGDTAAGSIDLVVGRQGSHVRRVNEKNEALWVDPNFKKDAARIYLSQKTDVDKNFGIVLGKVGSPKPRSAIAMKADEIRLVARGGIKLVTRTDSTNSMGGAASSVSGIDLIAGNDDSNLQPMTLGNNTAEALSRLTEHVDKLAGIVDALLMSQFQFNTAIATHFHYSPFFALPTTPSETLVPKGVKVTKEYLYKVKRSLVNFKINLASYKLNYLSPLGRKYINSRYNNTN